MPIAFQPATHAVDVEVPLVADEPIDLRHVASQVWSVHPVDRNPNLSILITGDRVSLTAAHAKVRRDGYRPAPRPVDQGR